MPRSKISATPPTTANTTSMRVVRRPRMKKPDSCDVVANQYWREAEARRKAKGALT